MLHCKISAVRQSSATRVPAAVWCRRRVRGSPVRRCR